MQRVILIFALVVAGCSQQHGKSSPYTLYRNSPLDYSLRIKFASFDAREADPAFNMNNCLMTAGLLNSNVNELAKRQGGQRDENVGFWCEPGAFRENGEIPRRFLSN